MVYSLDGVKVSGFSSKEGATLWISPNALFIGSRTISSNYYRG
jgi:hypothetical protein